MSFFCLAIDYREMSKSLTLPFPSKVSGPFSVSECTLLLYCSDLLIYHSYTYTVSSVKVEIISYLPLYIQTHNLFFWYTEVFIKFFFIKNAT